MGKVKTNYNLENIFGDLNNFIIKTNFPDEIRKGANIVIVNPSIDDDFDVVEGVFQDTLYAFIVDVEILDVNLSEYKPDNTGVAYADVKILKVKERGY